ncbi:MAG: DUF359 domain-containing protein [Candidatus Bathyarchaeia archaeon]
MAIAYKLTPRMRKKLKQPIGTLIPGSFTETANKIKNIINEKKPTAIISVGDAVSKNLLKNHIFPILAILDNKVMRMDIKPISFAAEKTVNIKNPPGTITSEAVTAIKEAMNSKCQVKIVVDGEEDLLTLIAVLYAPENSIVMYGQPHKGLVVIEVTPTKKLEVAEILKAMENVSKN